MRLYYDFHIHTALSPCGHRDMSPANIVNMALLKGLDVIAISDHNAISNCSPCMEYAKGKDIIVLPGIEVQTKEDVHILCLFKDINLAMEFDLIVGKSLILKNNPDYFGRQFIFDIDSNIIGEDERLLISSIDLNINQVFHIVKDLDGVAIPAHIDKRNFSMISNLGFIPKEPRFSTLEISKHCNLEEFIRANPYLKDYRFIKNSDAHYLGDISERENYIEVDNKTPNGIIEFLKNDN